MKLKLSHIAIRTIKEYIYVCPYCQRVMRTETRMAKYGDKVKCKACKIPIEVEE